MKPIVLLFIVTFTKFKVEASNNIDRRIEAYFQTEAFQQFQKSWELLRPAYEDAIGKTLRETFGSRAGTMNMYRLRKTNPLNLQKGYYFTDDVVHVVLQNLYLREIPRLFTTDISFPLHHNVIRVESMVAKLFADADYIVFRNKSDIVQNIEYPMGISHSPFSYEHVQTRGTLTIIGEDCHLIGQAVVTLNGLSVHIGHSTFSLNNCRFSVEINNPDSQGPPVIAPYFTKKQSKALETVLSTALDEELRFVLQGTLNSHINGTGLFGINMPKIRRKQKNIFQDSFDFMSKIARYMDEIMVQNLTIFLSDFTIVWNQPLSKDYNYNGANFNATIANLKVIDRLARLYTSGSGGPVVTGEHQIADELRIDQITILGDLIYADGIKTNVYNFAVQFQDLAISVKIKLDIPTDKETRRSLDESSSEKDSGSSSDDSNESSSKRRHQKEDKKPIARTGEEKVVRSFKVKGWKSLEFSSFDCNDKACNEQFGVPTYALITGYLSSKIQDIIDGKLLQLFNTAIVQADTINENRLKNNKKDKKSPISVEVSHI